MILDQQRQSHTTPVGGARRRIGLVAAVVTALLLVSSGTYVANYQPFGHLNVSKTSGACFEKIPYSDLLTADDTAAWKLVCTEPGDAVSWSTGLQNNGPIPVRLTGFPELQYWTFEDVSVLYGRNTNHIRSGDGLRPFEPFTIQPGEQYWFEFETRLKSCSPEDGHAVIGGMQVTYEIGPLDRRDAVPASPRLVIGCDL